jgi:hypothetical protein
MNKPTDDVITAKDRQCGCFTGVVMDLPGEEKVTARTVGRVTADLATGLPPRNLTLPGVTS